MDGKIISKSEYINVNSNENVLISTDKLKYNQDEDITIKLKSKNSINNQKVIICKNGQIVKMISTDEESIKTNLGDTYGIIDIYS